ncbi:MAG TPA: hypothetical protein K8V32_12005 [Enteractinococcus helveticum]|uniref:Secreted protein n=1 Tax=Enteractinococcus helveticum TaxID=1837282 RepID=A0A921FQV1_9MICC|nr:hypothetical protein [Enteractinococcus helveticum]HJF15497.1 hypothetical protein [Enteractinococcus helveticum]
MARKSFKQTLATLAAGGLLATGLMTASSVASAPEAQAAGCFVVQMPTVISGSCNQPSLVTFQCVGTRGSWAYTYRRATNFAIKKPCALAYNLNIKRITWN